MPKRRSRIKYGFIVVKVPKQRDYAAEYARRIARWLRRGLSRSQARGHPKPHEAPVKPRKHAGVIEDLKLQRALRVLRQDKTLAAAARAAHVSPERLKREAARRGAIKRKKRRWVVNPKLPRRMLIFSGGRQVVVTVGDFQTASLVGQYMSAVARFLVSNDMSLLTPFADQSVTDVSGKTHKYEVNPNSLYRLTSAGGDSFESVYRIVI